MSSSSEFSVDLAKSDRSKCIRCKKQIAKGSVRLGKLIHNEQSGISYPGWHHVPCFVSQATYVKLLNYSPAAISGFYSLPSAKQTELLALFKEKNPEPSASQAENADGDPSKPVPEADDDPEAKALREQSDTLAALRGKLEQLLAEYHLQSPTKRIFATILHEVGVKIPEHYTTAQALATVAELIAFGRPPLCQYADCGSSRLVPKEFAYGCPAELVWGPCPYTQDLTEEDLVPMDVPDLRCLLPQQESSSRRRSRNYSDNNSSSEEADSEEERKASKKAQKAKSAAKQNSDRYKGFLEKLRELVKASLATKGKRVFPKKDAIMQVRQELSEKVQSMHLPGTTRGKKASRMKEEARQEAEETHEDEEEEEEQVGGDKDVPATLKVSDVEKLFDGWAFLFVGKLSQSQTALKSLVSDKAGQTFTKVDELATSDAPHKVVVTTADAYSKAKKPVAISQAEKQGLDILDESWIHDCIAGENLINVDAHQYWKPYILYQSADNKKRREKLASGAVSLTKRKHSLASDTNSTQAETSSKKLKLTVTSDSAVDPRAGVPDSTRVHGAVGNRYDATLALVDTRKNMFYKLQVLTNGSRVWLFKAYGPIGTDGVCETKPYYDTHSAVSEFERLFLDKTKNQWSARRRFVKQPKAYYMMDVGYTSDSLGAGKPDIHEIDFSQSSTTLSPEVADLIKLIFDVGKMKETMFELEIDTEKMPLGNISKSQLNRGFEVLKSIGDVLTKRENGLIPQDDAAGMLAHRSNEFYTLVPHIGRTLPAIDSTALLVKKTELVETLVQMEITTRLLGSEQIGAQQSPLDFHYAQLKCDMRVLSPASDEYQLIQTYVTNSQGATHSHFKINIDYILVLNRDSETERFAKYQAWENRYLLWHGSRLTNWTGILSQGLKIAPPSAPVNGYMFGKGTYHANSITKSAGYCMASPAKPDAILILNEVALGRIHKFDSATYMEKPHRGSDSTHGVGMYQPSGEVVMRDGVVVPSGVLEKKGAYRSLMYDEFIVYDEGQSRMRYLVRLGCIRMGRAESVRFLLRTDERPPLCVQL